YTGLESGYSPVMTYSDAPIGERGLFIRFPDSVPSRNYINSTWIINVPNERSSGYATALKNYQTALQSREKIIADAKSNIGSLDSQSILDAKIKQAQASIDSIRSRIKDARIVAPIDGVITRFDAKVGQLASSGAPVVSMISNGGYEVSAGVSEMDISKITLGDDVTMTLDAFPNEIFTG